MQKIFEHYGGVIIVTIAVIALVAIAGIIVGGTNGGLMGESLVNYVSQFFSGVETSIDGAF